MLYDTRYHARFEYFDEPQVVVFTNSPPKMKYLSRDRWRLWTITKRDKELTEREGGGFDDDVLGTESGGEGGKVGFTKNTAMRHRRVGGRAV